MTRLEKLKEERELVKNLRCLSYNLKEECLQKYDLEITCIEKYGGNNPEVKEV